MKNFMIFNRSCSPAVVVVAVLMFAVPAVAHAQYSLRGSSFATVGSESSGGAFSVISTIGTTAGGTTVSGGNFSVTSSPWIVAVVETPNSPKLAIAAAVGSVKVSWPSPSTGYVLQQNTNDVSSVNWSNVTATIQDDGTTKMLILNPPAGSRFYRLFKP